MKIYKQKIVLIPIILLIGFVMIASDTLKFRMLNSFKIESFNIEVDNLNFVYVLDNNVLKKYNQKGELLNSFASKTYRNINNMDVNNPFKTFVFNYDFQMLFVLDKQLNLNSQIDLKNIGYDNIHSVYASLDNGFWLYDERQKDYIRTDKNLKELFRKKIGVNNQPKYAYSFSNRLYLFFENELLILDNTGHLEKKSFNASEYKHISIDNHNVYAIKNNSLCIFDENLNEINIIDIPYKQINRIIVKNKTLFLLDDEKKLYIGKINNEE